MFLSVLFDLACFFFFFNDTATTEIYTLSLHDALPIWGCPSGKAPDRARAPRGRSGDRRRPAPCARTNCCGRGCRTADRKSTRLNSSHMSISYAVFCLKKKKKKKHKPHTIPPKKKQKTH